MKKILCLVVALCLLMLCGCGSSNPATTTEAPETTAAPVEETVPETTAAPVEETVPETTAAPVSAGGPTDLDFTTYVLDMVGEWTLAQVFVNDTTYDATPDSLTLEVTEELDPSELVDGAAYIHNQVYNLTGYLTFGVQSIVDELAADDVESYKGSTAWSDFPQGEVVKEGEFYKQPGPATMRFKDIDDYGLYLDQIAGVTDDVETTEKSMIIGLNSDGQLLLGYSEEHLERPGTSGEWSYLLIFDKVA